MKVRNKINGSLGVSGEFNIHGMSEIIVTFIDKDGNFDGADSDYISNYEVLLKSGEWKDLAQAFREYDVIIDNYNTIFFEPKNDEDRIICKGQLEGN